MKGHAKGLFGLVLCVLSLIFINRLSAAQGEGSAEVVVHAQEEPVRTPLSLGIVYHKISYGEGNDRDIFIDNGAMLQKIDSLVDGNVPAILVNGVVAFPLILTTYIGYIEQRKVSFVRDKLMRMLKSLSVESASLPTCSFFKESWNSTCKIGYQFLSDYVPFLVRKPIMSTTTRIVKAKKTGEDVEIEPVPGKIEGYQNADERFVLFLRRDKLAEIKRAFNIKRLDEINFHPNSYIFDSKIFSLLEEVQKHTLDQSTLARTIGSIFNREQKQYSWNILITGHGWQMTQLDQSLLMRDRQLPIAELAADVQSAASTPEIEQLQKDLKARYQAIGYEPSSSKIHFPEDEQAKELITKIMFERVKLGRLHEMKPKHVQAQAGVIANLPPQQFGYLLDLFNQLPVNIIVLLTCYGGGYNASLVEQELVQLDVVLRQQKLSSKDRQALLADYEKYAQNPARITKPGLPDPAIMDFLKIIVQQRGSAVYRPYILISLAAFDDLSYGGATGKWLHEFDVLFGSGSRPSDEILQEKIEKILSRDCKNPPIMLMPMSDKFELLSSADCAWAQVVGIARGELMGQRSVSLLDRYAAMKSDDFLKTAIDLLQRAATFKKECKAKCSKTKLIDILSVNMEPLNDSEKRVVLALAISGGATLHVRQLGMKPEDIKLFLTQNAYGISALSAAIENNQPLEMMQYLFNGGGGDANGVNLLREPFLHLAVRNKNYELVKLLLVKGADVFKKDDKDRLPIDIAAESGDKKMQFLIQREILRRNLESASVDDIAKINWGQQQQVMNEKDVFGQTLLNQAIEKGWPLRIIEQLLSYGAAVNEPGRDGKFAFDLAQSPELKKMLDEHEGKNAIGVSAFEYAIEHKKPLSFFDKLFSVIQIEGTNDQGTPFLYLAAQKNNYELVKWLLLKGAEVFQEDRNNKSAVDIAVQEDNKELRLLIYREALGKSIQEPSILKSWLDSYPGLVNTKDVFDQTLLTQAIEDAAPLESVEQILLHGADVNMPGRDGRLPRDLAAMPPEMKELLERYALAAGSQKT